MDRKQQILDQFVELRSRLQQNKMELRYELELPQAGDHVDNMLRKLDLAIEAMVKDKGD